MTNEAIFIIFKNLLIESSGQLIFFKFNQVRVMFSYLFKFKWIILFFTFSTGLAAQAIQIPEVVPQTKFVDQHDRPHLIGADTRLLLYSHNKDTGSMMAQVLADVESGHMQRIQAVYIADISGMPSLISRFFALPKLRDIASPILVSRDPEQVAWIPKKENKLTLIFAEEGLISNIIYSDDEKKIRELLNLTSTQKDEK